MFTGIIFLVKPPAIYFSIALLTAYIKRLIINFIKLASAVSFIPSLTARPLVKSAPGALYPSLKNPEIERA
jgi:hypothetical protein